MSNVIDVRDLTRKFRELVAVDTLNFTVEQGEVFGLLGPNGAGKTTTLSMLCTILKPTSGTAIVNGYDITEHPSQVRRSIGIVFQEPSIDDRLTGRENLEMHADLYGVPKREQRKRIEDVLELVELHDKADLLMRTYSGGMRRRLEIARGFIHYPKVLFLDEPTLGLDPQTRGHIWTYISELSEREGITIILTTHYMEEADNLCDRVAIIDYGKIVALDEPDRLKEALEGDIISVKTDAMKQLSAKLIGVGWVKESREENGQLKLVVKDGNAALPRVVEIAASSGIHIDSMSIHEPTLEDVFLNYTGREIRGEVGDEYGGIAAIRRHSIK
ncbi:MAG: ATP-binding cassette domain-containing protein [Candidatus Bathyarchaeia archaeon]|jgi:ABC-2 type transport system ATP-binding protein